MILHAREGAVARPELADAPLPPDALISLEREQIVRRAFAALAARCRRLLDALFFESVTRPYEKIAADLGIAVGSIGPTRRRCLEALSRLLADEGFEMPDVSGDGADASGKAKRKRR